MSENRTSIFDFRRGLSVWAIWDKIVYISLLVSWQFYCICLPCVRFKDSVGLQMIPRSTTKQIRSNCPATAPKFGKFQSWILNFFCCILVWNLVKDINYALCATRLTKLILIRSPSAFLCCIVVLLQFLWCLTECQIEAYSQSLQVKTSPSSKKPAGKGILEYRQ